MDQGAGFSLIYFHISMSSKTLFDGYDAKYGADFFFGFGMQYLCGAYFRQCPDCSKIVIRNPIRNVGVLTLFACQFDDRHHRIGIPIRSTSLLRAVNKKWGRCKRSLPYVSLMMEIFPERLPDRCGIAPHF